MGRLYADRARPVALVGVVSVLWSSTLILLALDAAALFLVEGRRPSC
jgi:hypothetical protein